MDKPKSLHRTRRYGFMCTKSIVDQCGRWAQKPTVYIDGGFTDSPGKCREFAAWLLSAADYMEASR